jgi:prolyl 4-hydroxylase
MHIAAALRAWIVESVQRGCTFDSMVQSMVESGHKPGYARDVLQQVLGEGWRPIVAEVPAGERLRVPEPLEGAGATFVETPDRRVEVLAALRVPRIIVFGGVLAPEECEALCELALPRMQRARTINRDTGTPDEHVQRISDGMYFTRGEHELVARIEDRLAALMHWPVENGEGLQILRYSPGGEYQPHYDYFDPADPGSALHIRAGGNRVASLITYLRAPVEGGGTMFPDIGFEVAPVAGNAVFFAYDTPSPDSLTLHAGAPVVKGEKWIATKWVRAGAYIAPA